MKEELQQAFAAIKSGREDQARVLLAQMLKDDPEYVPGWVLLSKLAPNNLQKAAFLEKILALDPDHAYARQQMEALGAGVAAAPEPEVDLADLEEELSAFEETPVVAPPQIQVYDVEPTAEEEMPEPAWEEFEAEEAPEAAFEPAEPEAAAEEARLQMPISEDPNDFDAQAAAESLPPWLAEDEALLAAEAGGDEPGEAERMPPEPELPDWLKEDADATATAAAPVGGRVRVRDESTPAARPAPAARTGPPAWLINALIVILTIVFLLLVYFGIRLFT